MRERARALLEREPWGREHWDRLAEGQTFDGMESWLPWLCEEEHLLPDLLPPSALVALVEPRRLRDRAQELLDEEAALASTLATTWGASDPDAAPRLSLPFDRLLAHTRAGTVLVLAAPDRPGTPTLAATAFDPVVGDTEGLARRITALKQDGFRVLVAAEGTGSKARIEELLAGEGVGVDVVVAPLDRGVVLPGAKLALVAEADLTGRRRVHRAPRGARRAHDHYEGLAAGDYVVHRVHGIGRYLGMETREMFGITRDRLVVEFKGGDRVYVDSEDIGLIRRYTGGEEPKLSKMGGADWEKTRARVRKAVRDIAAELVVLYRRRLATPGRAFPEDSPWQAEMEAAFPYEETPDQLTAIREVKADMESDRPMDRLVFGDVGYGKTEVAIRAAFKAVMDGKQVAVLCPTTLLAQQHHQTFSERFAPYPIRVEMLSRFVAPAQARRIVRGIETGEVDVVIGTHRLLSPDVRWKDLGLLVVDEEQRFGVGAKDRIKELKTGVDVLTLTATPIPRTLEMALTGIRDVSHIRTPPEDRHPILTFVGPYDEQAVAAAIRRELLREGQVFYVHNRVRSIDHALARLQSLVPDARYVVAHGQMSEGDLEQVMLDFWNREYDVMVATTIIESGLDLPQVNTLIVERADLLGLSQLYQLRGRVGRSNQRAYAYLFHPPDLTLPEDAHRRLEAIGEATDLGSGFMVAMRDLEIRGAGSILGRIQSGHIAAVGFDLYAELVAEAVDELEGRPVEEEPAEIRIDLPVDAHLPDDYVPELPLRLEAYRRLASARTHEEVDDVEAEWTDRYGAPPPPAAALLDVARLRAEAIRTGVTAVSVRKDHARLEGLKLLKSQQARLQRAVARATVLPDAVVVPLEPSATRDAASLVGGLVALLREVVPAPEPVASPS
ncbi:MAG: transcription-repair-coupling factor [Acidimicrobiia bacterium]|nr:MAG: transcription-repair-coupling factor [Acidimicrobiia bacterium]